MPENRADTSPSFPPNTDFGELATRFFDGSLEPGELQQLNAQLLQSDSNCGDFVRMCLFAGVLRESLQPSFSTVPTPTSSTFSDGVADAPVTSVPIAIIHSTFDILSTGWPMAYLIATVLMGIGLTVAAIVHVSKPAEVVEQFYSGQKQQETFSEDAKVVGRISDMADCVLEPSGQLVASGPDNLKSEIRNLKAPISLGDRFHIRSGLLEITYDTGAKVILEGPVTYEVESAAGGYLAVGRLTARLENKKEVGGRNEERSASSSSFLVPSSLFAVRTPTATVTDLGTEFGVEVSKEGHTTSHVFRGTVEVRPILADGTPGVAAKMLHATESARVEASNGNRDVLLIHGSDSVARPIFVREIPKPTAKLFDLVDVVAGGNGFSGRRNGVINPITGRLYRESKPGDYYRQHPQDAFIQGDGRYHRVKRQPFIDGVFIPNGDQGRVQVDSAGHRFDGFLATNNTSGGSIHGGGLIPLVKDGARNAFISCKLGNVDYSSPGHGVLFLHANKGITFDLDAIRAANCDCHVKSFQAVAGICMQGGMADLWVLVDGKMRFKRRQVNSSHGAIPVAIAIRSTDRFLTLAATDGGNGISDDWTMFGDPRLELVPAQPAERRTIGDHGIP